MLRRDDGTYYTPQEAKEALIDELAKGHEVIPMGECDNFDYKNGCLGHPVKSPAEKGEVSGNNTQQTLPGGEDADPNADGTSGSV